MTRTLTTIQALTPARNRLAPWTTSFVALSPRGYEPVAETFQSFFAKAWDVGSAVSVYVRGEPVVRLDGRLANQAGGEPTALRRPTPSSSSRRRRSSSSRYASRCSWIAGFFATTTGSFDHWPEFAGGHAVKAPRDRAPAHDASRRAPGVRAQARRRRAVRPRRACAIPRAAATGAGALRGRAGRWRLEIAAALPPPQAYHAVSRGLYSSELVRRVDPQHRRLGLCLPRRDRGTVRHRLLDRVA